MLRLRLDNQKNQQMIQPNRSNSFLKASNAFDQNAALQNCQLKSNYPFHHSRSQTESHIQKLSILPLMQNASLPMNPRLMSKKPILSVIDAPDHKKIPSNYNIIPSSIDNCSSMPKKQQISFENNILSKSNSKTYYKGNSSIIASFSDTNKNNKTGYCCKHQQQNQEILAYLEQYIQNTNTIICCLQKQVQYSSQKEYREYSTQTDSNHSYQYSDTFKVSLSNSYVPYLSNQQDSYLCLDLLKKNMRISQKFEIKQQANQISDLFVPQQILGSQTSFFQTQSKITGSSQQSEITKRTNQDNEKRQNQIKTNQHLNVLFESSHQYNHKNSCEGTIKKYQKELSFNKSISSSSLAFVSSQMDNQYNKRNPLSQIHNLPPNCNFNSNQELYVQSRQNLVKMSRICSQSQEQSQNHELLRSANLSQAFSGDSNAIKLSKSKNQRIATQFYKALPLNQKALAKKSLEELLFTKSQRIRQLLEQIKTLRASNIQIKAKQWLTPKEIQNSSHSPQKISHFR